MYTFFPGDVASILGVLELNIMSQFLSTSYRNKMQHFCSSSRPLFSLSRKMLISCFLDSRSPCFNTQSKGRIPPYLDSSCFAIPTGRPDLYHSNFTAITMSSQTLDPRLVAIAVLTLLATAFVFRKRKPSPPGPPGLPFFGNMFDMPKKEAWKAYLEMGKQYGKRTFFWTGNDHGA